MGEMMELHTGSEYIIRDFLLERLGTSRQNYTGRQVAKELIELLFHPSYALRVAEVAKILKVEDSVATTCDIIELKFFR
jgi:hypothetical protein